jgi:hypothetical protein
MTSADAVAAHPPPAPSRRGWRWWSRWLAGLAFLTLLGVAQIHATMRAAGQPIGLGAAFAFEFMGLATLLPVAPLVLAAARRFPVRAPHAVRNALLLAAVWLACVAAHTLLRGLLREGWRVAVDGPAGAPLHLRLLQYGLYITVASMIYLGGIVLVEQLAAAREAEDAWELRAARLAEALERERLAALRGQLQPHFVLNALHGVSALMVRDREKALEMLDGLRELLRGPVHAGAADVVPLRAELDLLARYTRLQEMRFGARLRVEVHADPAVLDVPVPRLLLQPLVENAVKHAMGARQGPTHVEVRATAEGGALRLRVSDDGAAGAGAPASPRPGIGLANTRARLREHHGDAARMDAGPREGGGFAVDLVLPLPAERGGTA